MALGPSDLVLSYMAMTRVEPMWRFFGASFHERCVAAAAGGFAAIGLVPEVYDEGVGRHLDHDLRGADPRPGGRRGRAAGHVPALSQQESVIEALEHTLEIADRFGAERMRGRIPGLTERETAEAFGWICDRARSTVCSPPWSSWSVPGHTSVLDPPTAVRVVEAAGRSNGGITVDSCHHFNGSARLGRSSRRSRGP